MTLEKAKESTRFNSSYLTGSSAEHRCDNGTQFRDESQSKQYVCSVAAEWIGVSEEDSVCECTLFGRGNNDDDGPDDDDDDDVTMMTAK